MANRVIDSFNAPAGNYCVDIFVRDDGSFGFEEYRRDNEDLRGWFSLHRYEQQIYTTDMAALEHAKASVGWLAQTLHGRPD